MPIKYGRCINPNCRLRGKSQDAEDSSFVCKECQSELTESKAISTNHEPDKSNKLSLVVRVLFDVTMLGGVIFLLINNHTSVKDITTKEATSVEVNVAPTDNQGYKGVTPKTLDEWIKDFPVKR